MTGLLVGLFEGAGVMGLMEGEALGDAVINSVGAAVGLAVGAHSGDSVASTQKL